MLFGCIKINIVFRIGGSIPIVFAYYAEFCPLHGRGQKMALLLIFWACGGIYVSGLGWLIIPNDGRLPGSTSYCLSLLPYLAGSTYRPGALRVNISNLLSDNVECRANFVRLRTKKSTKYPTFLEVFIFDVKYV